MVNGTVKDIRQRKGGGCDGWGQREPLEVLLFRQIPERQVTPGGKEHSTQKTAFIFFAMTAAQLGK